MSSHYVPPPGPFLGYRAPVPQPRRSNVGLVIGMIALVTLLLSFGGVGVYVLVGDGFASHG